MATPMVIGLIGYIILMVVDVTNHKGTGYLAIFFCTIGVSTTLASRHAASFPPLKYNFSALQFAFHQQTHPETLF